MKFKKCAREGCERHFTGQDNQKYCSEKCRNIVRAATNRKPKIEKECANPACRKSFTTTRAVQKYCCLKCKQEHEREKSLRRAGGTIVQCARKGCSQKFLGNVKKKYCSPECAAIAKRMHRAEKRKENS